MEHGGDILTYENYYNGELIDYSSNINPLGPPRRLKDEIINNFDLVEKYPDIKYRKLKNSISSYLKCGYENILVGNGAMEIIDIFTKRYKRIITTTPAFSEYVLRGKEYNKEVIEIEYMENFELDVKNIIETLKKDDLLILGNPNNPTGLRIEKEELLVIYKYVCKKGAYLLLDEAFYEFVNKDYDSIDIFREYEYKNVGIIRAATKFFAIPGLRLGYGCVEKSLAEEIEKGRLTWSVNAFADLAGQIIFNDKEYIEKSKRYIEKEREFLTSSLKEIKGLYIYKTHTNYILIKLINKKEDEVFEELLKKGILVRKCSSFNILGNNHIRIAIKDRKSNEKLLKVLKEIDLGVIL